MALGPGEAGMALGAGEADLLASALLPRKAIRFECRGGLRQLRIGLADCSWFP